MTTPASYQYIRKTARGSNRKREQSIHARFVRYLKQNYPDVIFISDWAAGKYLPPNYAAERKSLQSQKGQPDILILYPSRGYHGLAIELKREDVAIYVKQGPRKGQIVSNEHIQAQAAVLKSLNDLGYCARFACGLNKAIALADWYFERPRLPLEEDNETTF